MTTQNLLETGGAIFFAGAGLFMFALTVAMVCFIAGLLAEIFKKK